MTRKLNLKSQGVMRGGTPLSPYRNSELSVLQLKRVLRALNSSGIKYSELYEVTKIPENTIKQFLHRTSESPRKTEVYFRLLDFVNSLDDEIINTLCKHEPALRQIVWRSADAPNLNSPQDSDDNLVTKLADEISQFDLLKTPFCSQYWLLRPSFSKRGKVVKSVLNLTAASGGIHFSQDQDGAIGEFAQYRGIVLSQGSNIFFLGASGRGRVHEMIMCKSPPIEEPSVESERRYDSEFHTQPGKYHCFWGCMLGSDSFGNPTSSRVIFMSPEAIAIRERQLVFANNKKARVDQINFRTGLFSFEELLNCEREQIVLLQNEVNKDRDSSGNNALEFQFGTKKSFFDEVIIPIPSPAFLI
jgi:hypothetical protein